MAEARFDAFLSYSKRENEPLARALHRGLHQLAKPWHRLRALHVFRDAHDLSASASLKASIKEALLASDHFVLIASPASAQSRWVQEEIALWRQNDRSPRKVLLVLAGGELRWDPGQGDFDWSVTTALPRSAAERWFDEEPLWVDMRPPPLGPLPVGELRLRNPTFQEAVATVAAPLRGRSKAQLVSEDIRLHRRSVRVRRAFVSALAVLSVVAASAAVVAWQQRNEAQAQARRALSRALAAASEDRADDDPPLSVRLGLYAYAAEPTPEAKAQLMRLIAANGRVTAFVRQDRQPFPGRGGSELGVRSKNVVLSPDGHTAALVHAGYGDVILWDTVMRRQVSRLRSSLGFLGGDITPMVAFGDAGRTLTITDAATADDGSYRTTVLGLPSGRQVRVSRESAQAVESRLLIPDGCRPSGGKVGADVDWHTPRLSRKAHRFVAVCGSELRVVDTVSGDAIASKQLPADVEWFPAAISGDGKWVAVGNSEGEVLGFSADLDVGYPLAQHSNSVSDIAINGDGSVVMSVGDTGDVVQSSMLRDTKLVSVPAGIRSTEEEAPYTRLTRSPDGRQLLVWQSRSVELWDTRLHVRRAIYQGAAQAVSFSPDGRRFAVQSGGTVRVRDTASLKTLAEQAAAGDAIERAGALAKAVGGFRVLNERSGQNWLGTGGRATVTAVWASGRSTLATTSGHPETAVNGQYVAVVSPKSKDTENTEDWTVTVWRCDGAHPPKELWQARSRHPYLNGLAVSDDGEYVVVGDAYNNGQIFRRSEPHRPKPMDGNVAGGSSQYIIALGQGIVVQHTNTAKQAMREHPNQLQVWDLSTGQLLGSWQEPLAASAVSYEPHLALMSDGQVATIRPNGDLGLWTVSPAEWRADLCSLATGDLTAAQRAFYLDGVVVPAPCPG